MKFRDSVFTAGGFVGVLVGGVAALPIYTYLPADLQNGPTLYVLTLASCFAGWGLAILLHASACALARWANRPRSMVDLPIGRGGITLRRAMRMRGDRFFMFYRSEAFGTSNLVVGRFVLSWRIGA